jgi:hypothetical protein
MSQKKSEILDNKRIALSLIESEYAEPILVKTPILWEEPIFSETPILWEEPIFSEAPILWEEPLIDSLTGITNNPTADIDLPPPVGLGFPNLSNAQLTISTHPLIRPYYIISGSVTVEISEVDMDILTVYPMFLKSTLWGEDSGEDNGQDSEQNDKLFSFKTQTITAPGIYTFSAIVSSNTLNEDKTSEFSTLERDEIYNEFSIVSASSDFSYPPINLNSITKHGYFR